MKLYLAGPMSGHPDHNFPAFHAEAKRLRALGYEIVNPAELNIYVDRSLPPHEIWQACMRRDIAALVLCDGIALMPGWDKSRGASFEYDIALRLEMSIHQVMELTEPITRGNERPIARAPRPFGLPERG